MAKRPIRASSIVPVNLWDEDGNSINDTNPVPVSLATPVEVVIEAIDGTPETFEDDNFVTGDSPAVLDCNTALGRNAQYFNVQNDGPGNFTVSVSNDGVVWGDEKTVKSGEVYAIDNISVHSLQITWVADSAYRVTVI